MPIFEYECRNCGEIYEELTLDTKKGKCPSCGSNAREMLISPSSSITGQEGSRIPGKGDTACCGGSPGASGCIPGSCCGKN